jgi:queuine/archaeosine tRNA-ribosyltransferase
MEILAVCPCPGCAEAGVRGLKASGAVGFYRRATHNLYVLLNELDEIEERFKNNSYKEWYPTHVFNNVFLKLINYAMLRKPKPSE